MRTTQLALLSLILSAGMVAQTTTVTGSIQDLSGATVTSGYITFNLMPAYGATISGTAYFVPTTVTCQITATGVKANDGVSACTVSMNTALTPSGTWYNVQFCPYGACAPNINWYALQVSQDVSTMVVTPGSTQTAFNVGSVNYSSLTSAGNATFLGLTLTSLNSSTPQCVHAQYGVFSLTGVDCGSGSGGGNVTGSSLTNYAAVFGGAGSAVQVDPSITTNGFGTLTALRFAGPINGTVGAITPLAGWFTSIAASTGYNGPTGNVTPNTGAFIGVTAKSYNLVLQADQYCTTPGTLDQSCLSNAVAALPGGGGAIHLRAGTYNFSSLVNITVPSGTCYTIFGDGQDVTIISAAGSGAIAFNYGNSLSCVTVKDLTIASGSNGLYQGLRLSNSAVNTNPALGPMTNVVRVAFRGSDGWTQTHSWATAIAIVNVSNVNLESVNVSGPATISGTGLSIQGLTGGSPSYAVVLNVTKSNFNWLGTAFIYGSYVQGVTFSQSNFVANTTAMSSSISETGGLDQLNVFDCQFGSGSAGQVDLITGTSINSVNWHNNLMFVGASGNAISYTGGNGTISDNQIICTSTSGSAGIVIASNIAPLTVNGNFISGCQTGISINSTDGYMTITNNNLYSNTASISGSSPSTTNYIAYNPGYNPAGISSPTPGGSPWTYTNGPSPATCYARATTSISQIALGGFNTLSTALGAGVMAPISLGPNEAAVITYAGTATLVCSVH